MTEVFDYIVGNMKNESSITIKMEMPHDRGEYTGYVTIGLHRIGSYIIVDADGDTVLVRDRTFGASFRREGDRYGFGKMFFDRVNDCDPSFIQELKGKVVRTYKRGGADSYKRMCVKGIVSQY